MSVAAKKIQPKSNPFRSDDFGAYAHKVNQFNVGVPAGTTKAQLEDPDSWVFYAKYFIMGAEIRCLAEDMSFVAYGICTFVQGSTAKIKIISMNKLDAVDYDELSAETGDYEILMRGPKKWSIKQKSTGNIIKEDIATRSIAQNELEDYEKALRS